MRSASPISLTLLVTCKPERITAFWGMTPCILVSDMTPYTLVYSYQLFFGACGIHLRGFSVLIFMTASDLKFVEFLAWSIDPQGQLMKTVAAIIIVVVVIIIIIIMCLTIKTLQQNYSACRK
jgi:hypothetical protein